MARKYMDEETANAVLEVVEEHTTTLDGMVVARMTDRNPKRFVVSLIEFETCRRAIVHRAEEAERVLKSLGYDIGKYKGDYDKEPQQVTRARVERPAKTVKTAKAKRRTTKKKTSKRTSKKKTQKTVKKGEPSMLFTKEDARAMVTRYEKDAEEAGYFEKDGPINTAYAQRWCQDNFVSYTLLGWAVSAVYGDDCSEQTADEEDSDGPMAYGEDSVGRGLTNRTM